MRIVAVIVALALAAPPTHAQIPTPIAELITEARTALDGLRYEDAAEIAATLLETGAEGYPEVEVAALQLLAAATYPEEEGQQNRERARAYLRRLVRTGPDASLPRDLAWPGLDSLLTVTRAETLVLYAQPKRSNVLRGMDATLTVPVQTTRPAMITLTVTPLAGGPSMVLAGVGPAVQTRIEARPYLEDGWPIPAGEYELAIQATDPTTGQTEKRRYDMTVSAPPLRLVQSPAAIPSSAFLPERTATDLKRSLVIGVGVGVATGIVAAALRADSPAGDQSMDKRAFAIAGTLSLAAAWGGWRDRGTALPDNVSHNLRLQAQHESETRRIARENERIRAEYRATITIGPEWR